MTTLTSSFAPRAVARIDRDGLSARSGTATGLFDPLEPRQLLFVSTVANPVELFLARLGQTYERTNAEEVAGFGRAVVNVGDIDQDGADDLAIGAPGGGSAMGLVDVYSGKTGVRLWTVAGDAIGFGRALARVDDVTGDSISDLAVGSPNSGSAGSVFIYSGATGSLFGQVIGSEHGAGIGANFGWSLDSGNADADTSPDLVIGAPSDGPSYAGRVYLINVASAATIRILNGSEPGQLLGWSVALLANENGPESLAVGSPGADTETLQDNGRIDQFSPAGDTLFTSFGLDSNDMLGFALAASRVAGTQYLEHLAVGAPGADVWSLGSRIVQDAGIVRVIDRQGGLWALLAGEHTGGLFGASLATAPRDGGSYFHYPSLIAIGSPGAPGGGLVAIHDTSYYFSETVYEQAARIQSTRLHVLRNNADTGFGASVAMGDFTGDTLIDAAVGASLETPLIDTDLNETTAGRARVYSAVEDPTTTDILELSPDQSWCLLHAAWSTNFFLAGPDGFAGVALENPAHNLNFIDLDNDGRLLVQRGITNQYGGTDYSTILFHDGSFTEVSNNISSWVGAPSEWTFDTSVTPVALLTDGSIIVQRFADIDAPVIIANATFWHVEGSTATFLWRGQFHNSSAAGAVGRRFVSYSDATGEFTWMTTLWTRSGGVIDIPNLSNAGAIDDAGNIVGVDAPSKTFYKRDPSGNFTALFSSPNSQYAVTLWAKALDSSGRLIWFETINNLPPGPPPSYWTDGLPMLFDPGTNSSTLLADGAIAVNKTSFGSIKTESVVTFTPSGGVIIKLYHNDVTIDVYNPGIDPRFLTPAAFAATATASGEWGASAFINSLGGLTLFTDEGDGVWRIRNVRDATGNAHSLEGYSPLIAWTDPLSHRPQFATLNRYMNFVHAAGFPESTTYGSTTPRHALWQTIAPQLNGPIGDGNGYGLVAPGLTPTRDIAILQRPDNLQIVAVRMSDGRVVLIGQQYNTPDNPFSFNLLYDLTLRELEPKNLPAPAFVGPISGFVSPWGGHNITGVDASGHIWTLWTSPEFIGWTITDLTDWLHADPISGGVTSFLTSWNAFNMTALNSSGELITMWWAPELGDGNWQVDFIGQGQTTWDTGVSLESWFNAVEQSLNFVGKDQTGQITCYTWSVADQNWRSEIVQPTNAADLVARVSPDRGTPSVSRAVGLGASGHLLWFYRTDDVATWAFEDITDLIA